MNTNRVLAQCQVNMSAADLRKVVGAKSASHLLALPSRCAAGAPEAFRTGAVVGGNAARRILSAARPSRGRDNPLQVM